MGTTCSPKWREAAETEHLWVTEAAHEGDIDRVFQGFFHDPQVRTLDPDDVCQVFADLVVLQAEYLKEADVLAEAEGYPVE